MYPSATAQKSKSSSGTPVGGPPDPVIRFAARIRTSHQFVAVHPQPLPGDAHPADFFRGQAGDVDIEQYPLGDFPLQNVPRSPQCEPGRRRVIAFLLRFRHAQRDGDGGHAADHRFHCRRNGPRIRQIVSQVGAGVNPGNDQIDGGWYQTKHCQRDAIRGCAVGHDDRRSIRQAGIPCP